MINISNRDHAMMVAKAIERLSDAFGHTRFTSAQYNDIREKYSHPSRYGNRTVQEIPTIRSLVEAKVIAVVDEEQFSKPYVCDRWGEKEFIKEADLENAEKAINSIKNVLLSSIIEEALEDNVDSLDCTRYYYKLNYHSLSDYINEQMSWVVDLVNNEAFF